MKEKLMMEKQELIEPQQSAESDYEWVEEYLKAIVQKGDNYKTGQLYDLFVEQTGGIGPSGKRISYERFVMFLRQDLMNRNGVLKRPAHGVYERRESPYDQGLLFTKRYKQSDVLLSTDKRLLMKSVEWEKLMDAAVQLNAGLKRAFSSMNTRYGQSNEVNQNIRFVQRNTMKKMDELITCISIAIALQEDQQAMVEEDQQEENGMRMGGIV